MGEATTSLPQGSLAVGQIIDESKAVVVRFRVVGVHIPGGGEVAKVKKTYSLDERIAEQIDEYAQAIGVSASAFIAIMVSQIGQVLQMSFPKEEKREGPKSGED